MNKTIKLLITEKDDGERLDVFLSKKIGDFSRSFIKKLIENKNVKVNEKIITIPSKKVKNNDKIIIKVNLNHKETLTPKKINLDIVYEDDDIVVVNKPKGLVVHPGAGNHMNTLANGLAYKFKNNLSSINGNLRPGIVHRIDKETSGLLVIAKNNLAHSNLGKQFSSHKIERKYQCLVWGVIRPLNGRIETLIARDKKK